MQHEKALAFVQAKDAAKAEEQIDFSGTWANELKSKMTIEQAGNVLTGDYTSAVSGTGGSTTGKLSGWARGRLISFTVKWDAPAITTWVGHLVVEDGTNVIETVWQMTTGMANPKDPNELWESVFCGADRFTWVS